MPRTIQLSLATLAVVVGLSACGKKADDAAMSKDTVSSTTSTTTTTTTPPATTPPASTTTTTTTTTVDANDIDANLNEYESLMNDYVALAKKAKAGDATAAQDVAALSTRMQTTSTNLANLAAKMTPEQQKRFTDLGTKAATEMQNAMK